VLVAVVAPAVGFALYICGPRRCRTRGIIGVELDGGALRPDRIAALAPLVRSHLLWDPPLILLYGTGLCCTGLGRAQGSAAVAAMKGYDADGNVIAAPPPAVPAPAGPPFIPVQTGAGMA
jgi:hypothetical protein